MTFGWHQRASQWMHNNVSTRMENLFHSVRGQPYPYPHKSVIFVSGVLVVRLGNGHCRCWGMQREPLPWWSQF